MLIQNSNLKSQNHNLKLKSFEFCFVILRFDF